MQTSQFHALDLPLFFKLASLIFTAADIAESAIWFGFTFPALAAQSGEFAKPFLAHVLRSGWRVRPCRHMSRFSVVVLSHYGKQKGKEKFRNQRRFD